MASESKSSGISFVGALTLIFIGLRLTGFIDWSWWWVFAPLWVPIALFALVVIVAVAYRMFDKS